MNPHTFSIFMSPGQFAHIRSILQGSGHLTGNQLKYRGVTFEYYYSTTYRALQITIANKSLLANLTSDETIELRTREYIDGLSNPMPPPRSAA